MGLNFNVRLYIKKEKLINAAELIFCKSPDDNGKVQILQKEGKLFKLETYFLDKNEHHETEIKSLFNENNLYGIFEFETDDKILEYLLKQHCYHFTPEQPAQNKISIEDDSFRIGRFDIKFNDYSDQIPGMIEICFTAVSSSLSRLLEESPSINKFFQSVCKEINAEYGCLDKEHEGYRLIWFQGKKYNINLPHQGPNSQSEPFVKYGFIPILRSFIMDK